MIDILEEYRKRHTNVSISITQTKDEGCWVTLRDSDPDSVWKNYSRIQIHIDNSTMSKVNDELISSLLSIMNLSYGQD